MRLSYGADLDTALLELEKGIESSGLLAARYQSRWVALKLLEGDGDMLKEARAADAKTTVELEAICKKAVAHVRDTLNTSMESVITDHRYGYIRSILRDGIVSQDPARAVWLFPTSWTKC